MTARFAQLCLPQSYLSSAYGSGALYGFPSVPHPSINKCDPFLIYVSVFSSLMRAQWYIESKKHSRFFPSTSKLVIITKKEFRALPLPPYSPGES